MEDKKESIITREEAVKILGEDHVSELEEAAEIGLNDAEEGIDFAEVVSLREKHDQIYKPSFNHYLGKEYYEDAGQYNPEWETSEELVFPGFDDKLKVKDVVANAKSDATRFRELSALDGQEVGGEIVFNPRHMGFAKSWLLGVLTGAVSVGMIVVAAAVLLK